MAGSPQDSQGIPLGAPNRRGAQWRDPVTLGCLIAGVLGAAGLVATVALGPHGLVRRIALLGFFCLELAILQIIPLRFTRDEEGEDLALDEAFFVPMALLLTPFETALALGIAMAAGQVYKRSPGLKALFNIGQTLASAAVGLAVFEALRGGAGSAAPRAIAAAAGGGVAYAGASSVAVSLIIAAAQRISVRHALFEGTALRTATWGGSISFGLLVFLATWHYLWAVLLTLAPVVALQLGYSSAVAQRHERHRVEELYAGAASVRSSMDPPEILERLRGAFLRLLDAQSAELVDPKVEAAGGALRTQIGAGVVVDVVRPGGGPLWTDRDRQLAGTIAEVAESAIE